MMNKRISNLQIALCNISLYIFVFSICINMFNVSQALVPFDRFKNEELGTPGAGPANANGSRAFFYNHLGESKQTLIQKLNLLIDPNLVRKEKRIEHTDLIISTYKDLVIKLKAFYILKQNNVIGYTLIEPVNIYKDSYPAIAQIKALPVNSNYLKNAFKLAPGRSLIFYEKKQSGFIERYAIISDNHGQTLLVENYYPKELDDYFTKKIRKHIKKYLKATQPAPPQPELSEDNEEDDDD